MDKYELKPCPFRGHTAARLKTNDFGAGTIHYQYECANCGASKNRWGFTPEAAAEMWNLRAESPNLPLTLEELRGMVEKPVWIEFPDMPNRNGWAINYGLDPDVMHVSYAEIALDMYGKTWLAYRRRPEEESNETD